MAAFRHQVEVGGGKGKGGKGGKGEGEEGWWRVNAVDF